MSKFYLKVISSNRIFYEGFCTCLIIPSVDGEKAIMAHHEEVIVAVDNGEMRMQKDEDEVSLIREAMQFLEKDSVWLQTTV